jgi:outer membrane protein OmpA-like peptidoglycan-associated protein
MEVEVPTKRGAVMIRSTLPILFSLAIPTSEASAQSVGIDPNSLRPSFRLPLQGDRNAGGYKRLPYQDLGSEIHIEIAADMLYDFDKGEVRSSAADYFQQAANLIFEEARGQVRIECYSDRDPPVMAQKLAERCANAIAQWMVVEEKLTKVKFTAVGKRVAAAAIAPNTNNLLPPKPNSRPSVTIVFAKK